MVKEKDKLVETAEEEDFRRTFEFMVDDEVKNFYLEMPTSEQIRQAEWHYSKVYNRALVEGVTTTSEMMDILTKRGLYGPDYEKKLQDLQVDIALKIAEMHGGAEDTKEDLAHEVKQLRDELYRWNQRLTGPLSNTCEQMAEDAKTEYLTSVVVRDEEGKHLWDTHDAFISEEKQGLALKARFEVLLWLQGLESDFLDKTPENKVLHELAVQSAEEEESRKADADAADKPVAQLEAAKGKKATKKPSRKRSSNTKGSKRKTATS